MKYKCIIFDCDGVLVDSEEISERVLIDMAKDWGLQIEKSYAEEHFTGRSLQSIFDFLEEKANKKLPANFEAEFRHKTFELFKTELNPIKGIHKLLDSISVPICVASSGPLEKIRLNLKTTGLLQRFGNNIFSAYQIGAWKPDPAIFLHAAKKMGFEAKDCVVIEDSIVGIKAAKTGGFEVYGYTTAKNKKAYEDEGAKVFSNMEDLIDILGTKNKTTN